MFMPGYFARVYHARVYRDRIERLVAGRFTMFAALYAVMIVLGILVEDATGMRLSGNNTGERMKQYFLSPRASRRAAEVAV